MKTIPLGLGFEAIVDNGDYEWLSKYAWHTIGTVDCLYVVRECYIYMSREIMNAPVRLEVDHIDGNRLNNQRSNLRVCAHAQNSQNRKKTKEKTKSKYKGVSLFLRTRKWRAYIAFRDVFGQQIRLHLGSFSLEEDAAKAYDKAARYYFGEFAALNFPGEGEVSCL